MPWRRSEAVPWGGTRAQDQERRRRVAPGGAPNVHRLGTLGPLAAVSLLEFVPKPHGAPRAPYPPRKTSAIPSPSGLWSHLWPQNFRFRHQLAHYPVLSHPGLALAWGIARLGEASREPAEVWRKSGWARAHYGSGLGAWQERFLFLLFRKSYSLRWVTGSGSFHSTSWSMLFLSAAFELENAILLQDPLRLWTLVPLPASLSLSPPG